MSFFTEHRSLKYKLTLSHLSMIAIPAALIFLTLFAWSSMDAYTAYSPEEQKGMAAPVGKLLDNSPALAELERISNDHPDLLLDPVYMQSFAYLSSRGVFLAVTREDEIAFQSEGLIQETPHNDKSLYDSLFHNDSADDSNPYRDYMEVPFQKLIFSDGSEGQLHILLTKPQRPGNNDRENVLIAICFVAVLINVWISYRTANGIIKPVQLLNQATGEIARGNLQHTIDYRSSDEIGELCNSFEVMRERLNEAENLQQHYEMNRKELLANISHDLKTPITSIRGYVQGIQDGVANTPEKLAKYTRTIYTNALEMDRLIDDLFLFSRLDLKQLAFDFEAVDIVQYMQDCAEDKSFELEQKGIRLEFENLFTSGAMVVADRQRLKRVISNILSNAEKYMGPEQAMPVIRIILSENDDTAVVEIRDNGRGMADDILPHIFERHYRGESSRSRPGGGSGLGLAIAQQIVEAHGGIIWAESQEGNGSSILFSLPKAGDNADKPVESAYSESEGE